MLTPLIKKIRQLKIGKCAILWFIIIATLALLSVFGDFLIDKSFQLHKKIQLKISQRLIEKHQVIFLSTLDDSVPIDATNNQRIRLFQIPLVKGKYGNGRRLNPENKNYNFQPIGDPRTYIRQCGTYSMWIKPCNVTKKQILLNANGSNGGCRLFIENNNYVFDFPNNSEIKSSYIPIRNSTNKFSHVAITFNQNEISLYMDGEVMVNHTITNSTIITPRHFNFSAEYYPFNGILDDIAIWQCALSQKEIQKIATSRNDLKTTLEPFWTFAEKISHWGSNIVPSTYRTLSRVMPHFYGTSLLKKDIPTLSLRMSVKDERHFKNHHEKSLKNGYRTKKAANFRKIYALINNEKVEFELALDDVYHFQNRSKRQSFLLKDKSQKLLNGSGIARIYPPELHLALHPDAQKPLPLKSNFIKLYIDDAFKGVYIIEPFDRSGSAWMAYDERSFLVPKTLYLDGAPAYEDIVRPQTPLEYNRAITLLNSDLQFPWSKQEIKARELQCLRARQQLGIKDFKPSIMPINDILGENRASLYITQNLKLPEGNFSWESSAPELITNSGVVNRPKGHIPKFVTLHCTAEDTGITQDFILRVMPIEQPIDTLFIYIGRPLSKTQRADFTCLRLPKNGGEPEWNIGLGSENSGVKQRGNTSYIKGKRRSLLLKFDNPVDWLGFDTPARHIILYSGYSDATRLRNKIAFDAFYASFNNEGLVPRISFTEVFINNEYFGLYETSQRVKDFSDNDTLLYKVRARDLRLWQSSSTEMLECVSEHSKTSTEPYKPISDLFTFVATASDKEFTEKAPVLLNIPHILSYFLVLNLSENYDGVVNNQYIAYNPRTKKWELIPWDYDKSFSPPLRGRLLTNYLFNRCITLPNANQFLCKKWTSLRQGPLSDSAIAAKIDEDISLIYPYLTNEHIWLYSSQVDSADEFLTNEFKKLKDTIQQSLLKMDMRYLNKTTDLPSPAQ